MCCAALTRCGCGAAVPDPTMVRSTIPSRAVRHEHDPSRELPPGGGQPDDVDAAGHHAAGIVPAIPAGLHARDLALALAAVQARREHDAAAALVGNEASDDVAAQVVDRQLDRRLPVEVEPDARAVQ